MKVLESKSALLTNHEVFTFLQNQEKEYQGQKRRGPGNLETLRRELLQYLKQEENPLSQNPPTYNEESIGKLLERLRPYEIQKGEMVMIMNLRPVNIPMLNAVLEDMAERFTDDEQNDICTAVAEVLGTFPPKAEGEMRCKPPRVAAEGTRLDCSHECYYEFWNMSHASVC
ncbi:RNA polymerase III subunit C17 [Apiospora arundinis]